jgi:hypothetical protein
MTQILWIYTDKKKNLCELVFYPYAIITQENHFQLKQVPSLRGTKQSRITKHKNINNNKSCLSDYVIEILDCYIVPTEELIDCVNHNFVSDEERRFKKQYCTTWVAIIVSLIIGVGGIITNIIINLYRR